MSKQPFLCFIAFGTATTVLALPSEEKDLVTNIKALYDPIGKGIAEVVVDGQGIEYCWRSHFGFAGEAVQLQRGKSAENFRRNSLPSDLEGVIYHQHELSPINSRFKR